MSFSQGTPTVDALPQVLGLVGQGMGHLNVTWGTVTSLSPAPGESRGIQVLVSGDTSSTPIDSLVQAGGTDLREGDRIILFKVGAQWVALGPIVGSPVGVFPPPQIAPDRGGTTGGGTPTQPTSVHITFPAENGVAISRTATLTIRWSVAGTISPDGFGFYRIMGQQDGTRTYQWYRGSDDTWQDVTGTPSRQAAEVAASKSSAAGAAAREFAFPAPWTDADTTEHEIGVVGILGVDYRGDSPRLIIPGTPPEVTIQSPTANAVVGNSPFLVSWSAADQAAWKLQLYDTTASRIPAAEIVSTSVTHDNTSVRTQLPLESLGGDSFRLLVIVTDSNGLRGFDQVSVRRTVETEIDTGTAPPPQEVVDTTDPVPPPDLPTTPPEPDETDTPVTDTGRKPDTDADEETDDTGDTGTEYIPPPDLTNPDPITPFVPYVPPDVTPSTGPVTDGGTSSPPVVLQRINDFTLKVGDSVTINIASAFSNANNYTVSGSGAAVGRITAGSLGALLTINGVRAGVSVLTVRATNDVGSVSISAIVTVEVAPTESESGDATVRLLRTYTRPPGVGEEERPRAGTTVTVVRATPVRIYSPSQQFASFRTDQPLIIRYTATGADVGPEDTPAQVYLRRVVVTGITGSAFQYWNGSTWGTAKTLVSGVSNQEGARTITLPTGWGDRGVSYYTFSVETLQGATSPSVSVKPSSPAVELVITEPVRTQTGGVLDRVLVKDAESFVEDTLADIIGTSGAVIGGVARKTIIAISFNIGASTPGTSLAPVRAAVHTGSQVARVVAVGSFAVGLISVVQLERSGLADVLILVGPAIRVVWTFPLKQNNWSLTFTPLRSELSNATVTVNSVPDSVNDRELWIVPVAYGPDVFGVDGLLQLNVISEDNRFYTAQKKIRIEP